MREININIEGYNVNEICVGCLNYNRKMFYDDDVSQCFKINENIDVPDGLTIQVCWECLAAVKAVTRFRKQILAAYDVLIDYSKQHTFLNSPKDLTQYSKSRLSTSAVWIHESIERDTKDSMTEVPDEIKLENDDADIMDFDTESIKEENVVDQQYPEVPAEQLESSDEEVQLSQIKERKEKKDHKKQKKDKKSGQLHQCDVCKAYFLTKKNLAVHRALHQSAYSSKSMLSFHRRTSRAERPLCDCCGKVFANKMTLKYHLMYMECGGSESAHPRRSRFMTDAETTSFMGSDAESDESDDELIGFQCIPRVFQSVMVTPLDQDAAENPELAADSAPGSDPEPEDIPLTATDQPRSLYDFDWRQFPNPQISPESRRETFSQSNFGPTTPFGDPYHIFIDIWDQHIMEHIASETNKYAQQLADLMFNNHNLHPNSRIGQWKDTTAFTNFTNGLYT